MTLKSSSEDRNEIEILLRLSQTLLNGIESQLKGQTDVSPYVRQYNFLKEKISALLGKDIQTFLPELPEESRSYNFRHVDENIRRYDATLVAVSQMVSYLETQVKYPFRILNEIEEFLQSNLRKNVRDKPEDEKEIQNIIEIMLNSKGYVFEREKIRIPYSNKTYQPDFTFEDLDAVLEVKLCKTGRKEKDLIDEINADIPPYTSRFSNVTFLIYDLEVIRDSDSFRKDIEKNNPRTKVLIIKH